MALRDWLQKFVTVGALTWSIQIALPGSAHAQPPAPDSAPASAAPSTTGEVPRLPDVNVTAEPPTPPVDLQPNFDPFEGETIAADNMTMAGPFAGYHANSSTAGSLLNIPDLYMPGTVSVIGKDLIRDQQALRINDVIRDIGAAVQTNNDQNRPDSFFIRGLEVSSYNYRKNGFMDPTYTPRDFANVERIDVFKGPASIAYGAGLPSGTVNLTTKKALQDRFAFGGATFGSYGLQRYVSDVNTMNQYGDVLMRVNTAYENRGGFRDDYYNNRIFVAPTVTFLLSEDTAVTWEGEFLQDHRRFDTGVIALNNDARAFPQQTFFGQFDDFQQNQDYRSTLSLVHALNDDWQFYMGGTNLFYNMDNQGTVPNQGNFGNPFAVYGGGPIFRTQTSAAAFREQNHAFITNLAGRFNTGRIVHNTITGLEADWFVVNHDQFNRGVQQPYTPTYPPFNGVGQAFVGSYFDNPGYRQNRLGLYFQDLMELTDRLSFMGGARWDTMDLAYNRTQYVFSGGLGTYVPAFSAQSDETFHRWSPRAGLIYELVPGALSTYGVYTRSFNQPSGSVFGSQPLVPELGETWEGGVKVNIFEDLTLTAAGFWIQQENVGAANSAAFPAVNNVTTGVRRSQGFELNLAGNWTNRLSTVSNYTYTDVTQTGPAFASFLNGRVVGVPNNLANIWTRYNFIQDTDRTLGIGLGWVYVGDRRGSYFTPLELESYTRWDLGLFGQLKRWQMATYVENVFDIRYETGAVSQYQIYPGAPTNFRMQIGVTF